MKKNLSRLLPFVGFLFVIAGIIGLIFVQKPLDQTQELRSDASETETTWPHIVATNPGQVIYVDEDSQISLSLNTGNRVIEKVNVVFNIISSNTTTPVVTVNAGSGLRAENKEVQDTDDGYLVSLKAVPNTIDWITQPNDVSFIKINFIPSEEGIISINFDEDNTYIETPALAYAIDAQTINFDIEVNQDNVVCTEDAFECPDGSFVSRIAPDCEFAECPSEDDSLVIRQCDEKCGSNMDCDVNYRCFDIGSEKRCRLATNPSSSDCSSLPSLGPNKQCSEYCADSNDCTQGLSCWYNECRNPNNVEDESCADLTEEEEIASVNSCGEYCSSNADCAVNLRCYDSVCRLVTNPSSHTCSATTEQTVSQLYEDNQEEDSTPLKKGDNVIPEEDNNYKDVDSVDSVDLNDRVDADSDEEIPVDETALDFILKMLKDKQQSLPTTVILIGIGLLAASLLILLVSKLFGKKPKYETESSTSNIKNTREPEFTQRVEPKIAPETSFESAQDTKVKDLLEKLKKQSKDQNQG